MLLHLSTILPFYRSLKLFGQNSANTILGMLTGFTTRTRAYREHECKSTTKLSQTIAISCIGKTGASAYKKN